MQLVVESPTTILRGLSLLAPKHRRSRVRWIVAAAALTVVVVLAADRSTREFTTAAARDFYQAHRSEAAAPPAAAPALAQEPAAEATSTPVAWPSAVRPQIPASLVASEASDAPSATSKEAAAPTTTTAGSGRANRTPKSRAGSSRPRTAPSQGGT